MRTRCKGPEWLQEDPKKFTTCDPSFVCDDPSCIDHTWSSPDRVTLVELKRVREDSFLQHLRTLRQHGPGSPSPNPARTQVSQQAFLKANAKLHSFVVQRAKKRAER